ncbi:MAG: hypothetical protein ACRDU4_01200 [Mycobacterium sp.]
MFRDWVARAFLFLAIKTASPDTADMFLRCLDTGMEVEHAKLMIKATGGTPWVD